MQADCGDSAEEEQYSILETVHINLDNGRGARVRRRWSGERLPSD